MPLYAIRQPLTLNRSRAQRAPVGTSVPAGPRSAPVLRHEVRHVIAARDEAGESWPVDRLISWPARASTSWPAGKLASGPGEKGRTGGHEGMRTRGALGASLRHPPTANPKPLAFYAQTVSPTWETRPSASQ